MTLSSAFGATITKCGSRPPMGWLMAFSRPSQKRPPFRSLNSKRGKKGLMNTSIKDSENELEIIYSPGEKIERRALGLPACEPAPTGIIKRLPKGRPLAHKTAIKAPDVLNEACEYGSAFTRGLR